jgi:hypothetical protein
MEYAKIFKPVYAVCMSQVLSAIIRIYCISLHEKRNVVIYVHIECQIS